MGSREIKDSKFMGHPRERLIVGSWQRELCGSLKIKLTARVSLRCDKTRALTSENRFLRRARFSRVATLPLKIICSCVVYIRRSRVRRVAASKYVCVQYRRENVEFLRGKEGRKTNKDGKKYLVYVRY